MTATPMSFAFGGRYDRILDVPELSAARGINLNLRILPSPKEAFSALRDDPTLTGGEMSVSFYLTEYSRTRDKGDLVALPVWVSRSFRHNNIYVREDSSASTPADLAGKRVGLPEYGMTMAVWLRSVFEQEYGVRPEDIEWVSHRPPAGLDDDSLLYPDSVHISTAPAGRTLQDQLLDGSIDAWIGAGVAPVPAGIRRLFDDPVSEERAYFARTGIFPIMHVLVLKRSAVDRDPDLAAAVFDVFNAAKLQAQKRLWSTSVPYFTLPWALGAVEAQAQLAGLDPWPYGIAANLPTLTALTEALFTQGLLWDQLQPGEGFAQLEPQDSGGARVN